MVGQGWAALIKYFGQGSSDKYSPKRLGSLRSGVLQTQHLARAPLLAYTQPPFHCVLVGHGERILVSLPLLIGAQMPSCRLHVNDLI